VPDADLHFERAGEGPPVLLVHGLGGSSVVWRPVRGRLEAERDVIVVDLPGFGRSRPLDRGTPASAANMARSLARLCAELGVPRPDVAGNSLGAWVALEMAKTGDARSACCISPAGLWRSPLGPRRFERQGIGRLIRPVLSRMLASPRGRARLLGTSVAHPTRVPPEEARALVLGYLDAPGYEAANRAMRAGAFEHEGRVRVPVTIAWGEADRIVAPPSRSRIPPGSTYRTVPGWGHTPTWDDPDGVAALILEASAGEG
jgi:pimeloyl-ACP methyl ester carboxylesterase